ncbi:hypothetical protein CLOM_g16702 [Closterium sp. NIES-68]|nr:hypothetical protein CLOM_g16702 [Closterium sp. NIES-68]GJP82825.1 hypothetical protein CLOP_g13052 [Closterium sp. NIES-67]
MFPQWPLLCCCPCCCGLWTYRRCTRSAEATSDQWPLATCAEFHDVPRLCHLLSAVYQMQRAEPHFRGFINEECVASRAGYEETKGRCPPYMIYVDHDARDICLAVRGLNTAHVADYEVLLDNKKGAERFDGGFVHGGMVRAAAWLLDQEMGTLAMLARCHSAYSLTLTGHSLGSGVVAMATVILHASKGELEFSAGRLRCFCMAPARSMSLNLAIKYADIINSVDDFLARTSAPVRSALAAGFCLPCMLLRKYYEDARISTADKLKDPRRLYAPGRLFHVLYRPHMSVTQLPHPLVKTAVPVDDRFERLVLSPSLIHDHMIDQIETKCALALHAMEAEQQAQHAPPEQQCMQRSGTAKERRGEHLEALARAVSLHVAQAVDPLTMPHTPTDEGAQAEGGKMAGEEGEQGEKEGGEGGKGGAEGEPGKMERQGDGEAAEGGIEKMKAEVGKVVEVVAGKWSAIVDDLLAKAALEVTRVAPGLADDNAHEWK